MKKLLIPFCLFFVAIGISAQSATFEGSLVYLRKLYDEAERIEDFMPSSTIKVIYTVKGNLSLIQLYTQENLKEGNSISIITDIDKKERTLLTHIADRNLAVKIDTSNFNSSRIYKISPAQDTKIRKIAGLSCQAGYAIMGCEIGIQDTLKIWYTTSYKAIPFQFDAYSGPGLIVSMQQDASSYWELTEIREEHVETTRFVIPSDYSSITENGFKDFLFNLEQFEFEDNAGQNEKIEHKINQEEED